MPNIGPAEIIVILVIALLVLGPKKLPEVGKSLGKGMREFKDSISSSGDSHDHDEPILPRERRAPAQVGAPPQPVEAPVANQSVTEDR
ncbi:MAG: twin-arginine translocase TatA/TatE family subunit [Patulibacter sp.]|nr:twin-arginine translocase TatA/TatE family subunit [Patulibacter sp.]